MAKKQRFFALDSETMVNSRGNVEILTGRTYGQEEVTGVTVKGGSFYGYKAKKGKVKPFKLF